MIGKLIISVLSLSVVGGSAAMAQEEGDAGEQERGVEMEFERAHRGPGRFLARFDENQDGSITADEFGGERLELLNAADEDENGTLTRSEIADYLMRREYLRRAEHAERRLDIDGDGEVTIAEIEERQGKRFALMDRDGDGQISREEMRRSAFEMPMMHGHFGRRWHHFAGRDRHGPHHVFKRGGFGPHHAFRRGMKAAESVESKQPATTSPAQEAPAEE